MKERRERRAAGAFLCRLMLSAALLAAPWGCGDDDGEPAPTGIHVQDPSEGEEVGTHSLSFRVTLDPDLDPADLRVTLNGTDVSDHLRPGASGAEGHVSGMQQGDNELVFTVPDPQGRPVTARVRFRFSPRPVEEVALSRTLRIEGLGGIVDVLIDPWGVPHIYTMEDNPDDLAFAQGYFTARQRLFQIDFYRKVAQGRLAELLGTLLDKSVLETDLFFRTLFLTYERGKVEHIDQVLAEEVERTNPEVYRFLSRYAEGVSRYIEDLKAGRNGAVVPQQYQLLGLLGPYDIEPMTVAQLFAIGRLQQFLLSETLFEEMNRQLQWDAVRAAEASGAIPEGTLEDAFRAAPPDPTTILKPGEPGYVGPSESARGNVRTASRHVSHPVRRGSCGTSPEAVRRTLERMKRIRTLVWGGMDRAISNNWILASSMTKSGFAIVANDPHLSLTNPSVFHPVQGDNKSFSHGDFNFSGCTFPGIPGIMLGQNERVAWGGTVSALDVTDLYAEEVRVDGGTKSVLFEGRTVPVETVYETFRIRGGDPVVIPIDFVPHHGPQVQGDPYSTDPGLSPENNLTVRWTGHFLTRDIEAFYGLLSAADIDDFLASLENFGTGGQNWVGGDVNGEIAYHPHALVPIRPAAALTPEHPPWLPYPGTGGYEWLQGPDGRPQFLPSDQIPQARNPERGWLVTANNDITGTTLDNDPLNDGQYLYYSINVGFRNGRITELLLGLDKEERDVEAMKEIQGDHYSVLADRIRPFLLEALGDEQALSGLSPGERAKVEEAAARIAAWDLRSETGMPDPFTGEAPSPEDVDSSIACSLFFACLNRITEATFDDEMDRAGVRFGSVDRAIALLHILEHTTEPEGSPFRVHTLGPSGQSRLWDDVTTPDREETRNEIMVQAMVQALEDLTELMGSPDMETWRWGEIHRLTFRLEGLGGAIYAYNLPSYGILDQILGRPTKGYPRPGSWATVDPADNALHGTDFSTGHGPAMRMVIEMEEGVLQAWNVLPGGGDDLQPGTGLAHPVRIRSDIHYGDQIPLWLANRYRPQYIFWEDVTQVAESRIRMVPD